MRLSERVPSIKTYNCVCIVCRIQYVTTKELDLDGKGRCVSCQARRDLDIANMVKSMLSVPKDRALSLLESDSIEFNGIKFYSLK